MIVPPLAGMDGVGGWPEITFHFTPVDDENHLWVLTAKNRITGADADLYKEKRKEFYAKRAAAPDVNSVVRDIWSGKLPYADVRHPELAIVQDIAVQAGQVENHPIATPRVLGRSDAGLALWRRILERELQIIAGGAAAEEVAEDARRRGADRRRMSSGGGYYAARCPSPHWVRCLQRGVRRARKPRRRCKPCTSAGSGLTWTPAPILYGIQAGDLSPQRTRRRLSEGGERFMAVAAAVAGGALEIGKSSLVPLISAHARNVPLTVIAPSVVHRVGRADSALMVAVDSPVRAARDLNGKAVSVAGLNDMQWLATHAWLDANGGDSSSVHFLEIPGSSVGVALEQGRISGGTLSEPYITQAIKGGKARILAKMVDAFGGAMTTAFFTSVDYATKNRDLVGRFSRAIVEASAYCNTHSAEMVDLMAS